jgi:F-type H+-transporting ATPase subunit delta
MRRGFGPGCALPHPVLRDLRPSAAAACRIGAFRHDFNEAQQPRSLAAARIQATGSSVAQVETSMSGVAGRYATALFDLAAERNETDAVAAELASFSKALDASDDLKRLIRSPVFGIDEQSAAIGKIIERMRLGKTVGDFLRFVTQKRRLFAIPAMIRAYQALLAAKKGIVPAEVTVAEPMPAAMLADLKAALAKSAGAEVSLDVKLNPDIIGGMVVKLGSRMIDASLKTKLNALRVAMREVN